MADSPREAGEPPAVEMFGALELQLSSSNSTGYCDVYPLKGRKKKPFQAKIYRPWRKDFVNLGTFAKAHEAAVAVARQRFEGIEDFPSPDNTRTKAGQRTVRCPALPLSFTASYHSSAAVHISCDREAKAYGGDAHRHPDAYYSSKLRKQVCAAASREAAAVVNGRKRSCLCSRPRWRCAALARACTSAGGICARSGPTSRWWVAQGPLSRLRRTLPAFTHSSDACGTRLRRQSMC